MDKLITYLGFAVKSRNILFGVDNIEAKPHKVLMAVYDNTLSENSRNKLNNIATRNNITVYYSETELSELLNKNNCKAIGITSKDLAKAIKELNILKEVRN